MDASNGGAVEIVPRHEDILDQMYDGVYFVDTDMAIRYWNHKH